MTGAVPAADVARAHPTWFEAVPADPRTAEQIVERIVAEELLAVMVATTSAATAGHEGLHRIAHTAAYDAARKSVDAVLLADGWRVTREGGHVATVRAAESLLVPPPGSRTRNVDAFRRSRNVRHDDEYPRPERAGRPPIQIAERRPLTQNCVRLVNDCRELLGLDRRDDLVPTDAKVAEWNVAT